jgi:hypothetical protein
MESAWRAAMLSGVVSLVFVLWYVDLRRPSSSALLFVDPLLLLAAGYGVLRGSRLAAAFLVLHVATTIAVAVRLQAWLAIAVCVPFAVLYVRGLAGAAAYHALRKASPPR